MAFAPLFGHFVRRRDSYGSGAWQASRDGGRRRHEGIDFVAAPGTPVLAPADALVVRAANPYRGDRRFGGVLLRTDWPADAAIDPKAPKVEVKILYLALDPGLIGRRVTAGTRLGVAQDIGLRYPGITPHIHVEVWVAGHRVDPTGWFDRVV